MRSTIDHIERFIRIVVGLILGNLGFANPGFHWLDGQDMLQVAAVVVSLYLVLTGLTGICPIHLVRTRRTRAR